MEGDIDRRASSGAWSEHVAEACHRAGLTALVVAVAVLMIGGGAPANADVHSSVAKSDVVIGHAGMLRVLVQNGLTPALAPRGIAIQSVSGNSLTVARNIRDGSLPADLFGSADANANQLLMGDANGNKVRWFGVFARNSVVLAYSPKSPHIADFERAKQGAQPWYEPLKKPAIRFGRDNPDNDPLGYYGLFVALLAEKYSAEAGLKQRILGDDRNPAQVGKADVAKLRSGELDAMYMYATGATSAGVPFVSLPPEVNLSDPAQATGYASASFTNIEGTTFRGGVIYPSIAPIDGAKNPAAARAVLKYLFSPDGQRLLEANGFLPSPLLVGGDRAAVPTRLQQYVRGTFPPPTGDVLIGHAGMLNELVRLDLAPALAPWGIAVKSEGGNTLTIARRIRDGSLPADLFGSADANANALLMGDANANKVRWFAAFARAEMVLAYSPRSRFLAEFEKAQRGEQPWYEPLKLPGVQVARANPDSDPSGYFTLLVGQLAERFSGEAGLKQRILGDDRNPAQVIGPASGDVFAKFLSGEVDALFMYRHIAPVFGVPFVSLPPEQNLSDPAHEAGYATASFTNAAGETFRGGVIRPSMAPVEGAGNAPAAIEVLDYLFSADGEALANARGFLPGPLLVGGDPDAVPKQLRRYIDGSLTERTLRLTVRLRRGCSVKRLAVSGDGVTVTSATPLPHARCRLRLHAAAAATGDRDLVVRLAKRTITIDGAVRLSYS